MEEELCAREKTFVFQSFGTFEVVDKVARPGRNPKTKEEVIIARSKGSSIPSITNPNITDKQRRFGLLCLKNYIYVLEK